MPPDASRVVVGSPPERSALPVPGPGVKGLRAIVSPPITPDLYSARKETANWLSVALRAVGGMCRAGPGAPSAPYRAFHNRNRSGTEAISSPEKAPANPQGDQRRRPDLTPLPPHLPPCPRRLVRPIVLAFARPAMRSAQHRR